MLHSLILIQKILRTVKRPTIQNLYLYTPQTTIFIYTIILFDSGRNMVNKDAGNIKDISGLSTYLIRDNIP